MDARRNRNARRPARAAAVGALVLVVGLASGPGSQAEEAPEPVELTYTCPLPDEASGEPTDPGDAPGADPGTADPPVAHSSDTPQADAPEEAATTQVTARVETRLPATATTGEPLVPGPVTLTTAQPYDDIAALLPPGTRTLTGAATLAVGVRQGSESADLTWSRLAARGDVPPAGAELRLAHTGEVASVTAGAPGDLTLTAGRLDLEIGTATADGTPGAEPLHLACTLADGQDALLATVTVTGGEGTPGPDEPSPGDPGDTGGRSDGALGIGPGGEEADVPAVCPDVSVEGDLDTSYAPPPPDGTELVHTNPTPIPACAYASGLASVRKLDGSMVINDPGKEPALMHVLVNKATARYKPGTPPYTRYGSVGAIELPDAESTFLAFGFMPVSAKVAFDTGPVSIFTGDIGLSPKVPYGVIGFRQQLRLYDVRVNGTPLDVGARCRTEKPFRVTLRGAISGDGTGSYTNVLIGGLLTGNVSIPAFTGCVTPAGETLNDLFTASLSGDDNLIAMNQATVCLPKPVTKPGCPPALPQLPDFEIPVG